MRCIAPIVNAIIRINITTIKTHSHAGNTAENFTSVVDPEFVCCSVILEDTDVSESCEKTTIIRTDVITSTIIPMNIDCTNGNAAFPLILIPDLLTHNLFV